MKEGPLDMRMDPDSELTAADIVNSYPEENKFFGTLIWKVFDFVTFG